MPRMRLAILSGWKGSRSSGFSPVPLNLIGLPVTALMDSAAPPRVSPSSLVMMTPVMSRVLLKVSATVTASCPVMLSTTSSISAGFTAALTSTSSFIRASSMWSLPAVSMMTVSKPFFKAYATPSFAILTGLICPMSNTSVPTFLPTMPSCCIAAGR